MKSLHLLLTAFTILFPGTAQAAAAAAPVSGKAVVQGKTLTLRHAWLVRAPDKFDKTKLSSYIVLSADDVSADIRKCPDRKCVLYEALKNGMVVEPREGGFWAFVAHPDLPVDTQFSGPSAGDQGWKLTARTADRLAGTLKYEDQDRKTSCDLTMDAPFLKEFPAQPAAAPAR
jgi:hypothetical protein